MAETRKRDRAIALGIAVFFFLLASGTSILVIVQAISSRDHTNQASNSNVTTNTTVHQLAGTRLSGFTPVSSVSTLQSTDTKIGTGATAKAGDTVTVEYTGAVAATGVIFQSTKDSGQPATLSLGNVIKGWQEGIPGMKVGGTRRLVIPAADAYGANPPQGSGIPANAPLVFDVTLVKVGN